MIKLEANSLRLISSRLIIFCTSKTTKEDFVNILTADDVDFIDHYIGGIIGPDVRQSDRKNNCELIF